MEFFRRAAAAALAPHLSLEAAAIETMLVKPPKPEMGDLGFPCFTLAKELRQAPPAIAAGLAAKVEPGEFFTAVRAVGPYVNFSLSLPALAAQAAGGALAARAGAPLVEDGRGRTVVIDYSSPNLAKPLAIHHLRTNAIGAALARLYRAAGWQVVTINHLGDWGTTFGQLMVSYQRAEAEQPGQKVDLDALFRLYVKFHADAEDEESLGQEARDWFKRLEDGDPEAKRLWELFVVESLKPLKVVYERLGLTFDHYLGESFYNDKMEATIARLAERGLLTESAGAQIVDLERFGMPPCLIRKKDGATTYATRDLAAAEYRHATFGFEKCLYVVANQQELHFRQVFKVLELMGYAWAAGCEHIKFGMLSLGIGVFGDGQVTGSTRKGRVVFLEEVLNRSVEKTRTIVVEHAREEEVKAQADILAEQIGTGAVVFTEFMQRRLKDIVFTWEKALNLQGDSGPYLQYTHARLSSVQRRYDRPLPANVPWGKLETEVEREVLLKLAEFSAAVRRALAENEPSVVADYLLELCAVFNRFFTDKNRHRIIGEDEELTAARVGLVEAVRRTLATGLTLLGLAAPERM